MSEIMNGFLQFVLFAAAFWGLAAVISYLCMTYDKKQKLNEPPHSRAARGRAESDLRASQQAELDLKVSGLALENALVQIGCDDQEKKQQLDELLSKPTTR